MSKRFWVLLTALVMSLALLLTGCGGDKGADKNQETKEQAQNFNPDEEKGAIDFAKLRSDYGKIAKKDGEIKLGAVAKSFENEYWRTLKEGMELGAADFAQHGYKVTIDVKSAQSEGDEQGQFSIVKDMINKKYSALLLSPISDGNLIPGVEMAQKANIPTINVNDGIIAIAPNYVGPRAIQNGELAAEWIAQKLDKSGKVAIVIGMPKAFAARQRTAGFENWMKENAPGIQIVEKQNADWDRAKSKDLAATWIKKHPDLKAIFCNNDTMALGVVEAVKEANKDILVVGVDGIGEAYDSIRKGGLSATIDSFPKYKGQVAVEVAMRILAGEKMPRVIWTPQALIDATNVNTPAEEIIHWTAPKFE